VAASATKVTELFAVGPVVAAMSIGYTRDIDCFLDSTRAEDFGLPRTLSVGALSDARAGLATTHPSPGLRRSWCRDGSNRSGTFALTREGRGA
jgi:hypothetical protein